MARKRVELTSRSGSCCALVLTPGCSVRQRRFTNMNCLQKLRTVCSYIKDTCLNCTKVFKENVLLRCKLSLCYLTSFCGTLPRASSSTKLRIAKNAWRKTGLTRMLGVVGVGERDLTGLDGELCKDTFLRR
jgi:hypothetical protein